MNRRGFLQRLGTGVGAVVAAAVGVMGLPSVRPALPTPSRPELRVNNISIRYVKNYDIAVDTALARVDVFYGVGCLRPDFACRVTDTDETPGWYEGMETA